MAQLISMLVSPLSEAGLFSYVTIKKINVRIVSSVNGVFLEIVNFMISAKQRNAKIMTNR